MVIDLRHREKDILIFESYRLKTEVHAQLLSCNDECLQVKLMKEIVSPIGIILAEGAIRIFNFEKIKLLNIINLSDYRKPETKLCRRGQYERNPRGSYKKRV